MKSFTNISQSHLKSYSKLTQKKYRQDERRFLVEGVRVVEEALKSDWDVESIIVNSHGLVKDTGMLENLNVGKGVELFSCPERDFKKISDTVTSQGIVAVVRMKEYSMKDLLSTLSARAIIVAIDDIADPGNLGTILRTCDWFGVDCVLLSKNTVDLFNSKVVRGTMGAIFHLPIIPEVDLGLMIRDLRKESFKVITTVLQGGQQLNGFLFSERSLIIFGNEAHGVSNMTEQLADQSITVPKFGKAESLNVGISCGIILNAVKTYKE